MNEQPSLMYGGTTGFVAGSDTSKAHAEFEKDRAGTVQARVLNIIIQTMVRGATSQEVEDMTGGKHQSVSAAIRNMELDGKVVKTIQIRHGQHAYVSADTAALMKPEALLAPNPVRSWKKKHDTLVDDLEVLLGWLQLKPGNILGDSVAPSWAADRLRTIIEGTKS